MVADRTRVVIPMKPLHLCKLRLAPILDDRRRTRLTLWMLERVVLAAASAGGVSDVSVLGGDAAVSTLCERLGLSWQADTYGDLNQALASFYQATHGADTAGMLFLAGDLPSLRPDDVDELVRASENLDLVLVPGARGGTNAMLLRTGLPFQFELGEQSFRRHREQADSLGLTWRAFEAPALYADVDLPSDFAWLEREWPDLWQEVAASGIA